MPQRRLLLAAAAALLLACGCVREFVQVKVEPRPDGSFVRTVRLWKVDDDKDKGVLPPDTNAVANAAEHYMERIEDKEGAAGFRGTFYHTVPTDILHAGDTNRGAYTVWRSPLGHMAYYRERPPGRVDVRTRFHEAEASIDTLVKLTTTMARQQLDGEAGLDKLVAYLDGPFRRDLKEASFHLYAQHLQPRKAKDKDNEKGLIAVAALILELAEERGHLKAKDLPKLSEDKPRAEFLMQLIARRMERPLDAALRGKLALVGNAVQAKAAFEKALPVLGLDGKQFEQQMLPFTDTVLAFEIFPTHPTVRYDLVLPPEAELRHSNGTLDAKTRQVEHTQLLTPRPVSRMFFALWSVPDTAWQTKHLGGVVLRGQALEEYITWESALDDAHAKVWRQAVERLDPKQDLPQQLAAIHTGPVPVDEEVAPEEGARLLISALKRPKKMVDPLDP